MSISKNLGIVSPVPMGTYSSSTSYKKLNIVSYEDTTYIVKKACLGIEPGVTSGWEDYYMELVSDGAKGDTGDAGLSIYFGTVTGMPVLGLEVASSEVSWLTSEPSITGETVFLMWAANTNSYLIWGVWNNENATVVTSNARNLQGNKGETGEQGETGLTALEQSTIYLTDNVTEGSRTIGNDEIGFNRDPVVGDGFAISIETETTGEAYFGLCEITAIGEDTYTISINNLSKVSSSSADIESITTDEIDSLFGGG